MVHYRIFGPFKLPRPPGGLFDSDAKAKKEFWQHVDQCADGLSRACGCYVLSVRKRAWYVGLTQRNDFAHECFLDHKVTKINKAIFRGKGDAYLHLLARTTPRGRFAKPSPRHKDIEDLEKMLITLALERNDKLLNKSDTKFYKNTVIPGILNSSHGLGRANSVRCLKRVLGVKPTMGSGQAAHVSLKDLIRAGILKPGNLTSIYKGIKLRAVLMASGQVRFENEQPDSPSGAAVAAKKSITGESNATDGWAFWHSVNSNGKSVSLRSLRRDYLQRAMD